jgi:hypothetical protein
MSEACERINLIPAPVAQMQRRPAEAGKELS